MIRRRRVAVIPILTVFIISVPSHWNHDHAGHGEATSPCAEAPGHFCTEEGHHGAEPCILCGLRTLGQEWERGQDLSLPFFSAVSGEVPDRAPVGRLFLPLRHPRGPPTL